MVGAPGVPWPEANALTESLKLALSSGSRYLDITVMSDADGPEKDATEWQTLQPRQQLNAVPYAMNGVPTGTVVPFAGSNAPDGWVICDGTTTLSIADPRYSRLHDTIGNAFNDGTEPADHFRVPDLRGRTVIGSGQGDTNEAGGQPTIWELAQKTGKETHTLSVAEMPSHNHGGGNHKHGTNGPAVRTDEADYRVRFTDGGIATGGTGRVPGRSDGSYNTRSYPNTRMSGEIVQPSGGDLPHNNMQPSLVLNYIIKL
jgi:microcystin-dependent protein